MAREVGEILIFEFYFCVFTQPRSVAADHKRSLNNRFSRLPSHLLETVDRFFLAGYGRNHSSIADVDMML
jgi:hypothetical protein